MKLIIDIHTTAFGHLYEWAGKWRTEGANIGIDKEKVPYAMAERNSIQLDNKSI